MKNNEKYMLTDKKLKLELGIKIRKQIHTLLENYSSDGYLNLTKEEIEDMSILIDVHTKIEKIVNNLTREVKTLNDNIKIPEKHVLNNKKDEGIELLKGSFKILKLYLEKKDVLEFNDQNYDEMCTLLQHCKRVRNIIRDVTLEIQNIEKQIKESEGEHKDKDADEDKDLRIDLMHLFDRRRWGYENR
jgi:hypothetical protein